MQGWWEGSRPAAGSGALSTHLCSHTAFTPLYPSAGEVSASLRFHSPQARWLRCCGCSLSGAQPQHQPSAPETLPAKPAKPTGREPHVQACRTPLFVRGNLVSDSIRWLKGSDLVFSAVKQWFPQWDENREMQKRFSDFSEPGGGCQGLCWGQSMAHAGHQPWAEPWVLLMGWEKLLVSGAATAGPSPGSGSAPRSASAGAGSPQDDFPRVLSLPRRKGCLSPSSLAEGGFILQSPKSHQLLPTAAAPWPRLSAKPGA